MRELFENFYEELRNKFEEFEKQDYTDQGDTDCYDLIEKYKEEVMRPKIQNFISKLTNKELYTNFESYAGGDDYDGGYSTVGKVIYQELKKEIEIRLAKWMIESRQKG